MSESNVVSINASIVHVDVLVELLLVSVNVNLVFGPFNEMTEAQEWADKLGCAHAHA
jgi:hypothetical protein